MEMANLVEESKENSPSFSEPATIFWSPHQDAENLPKNSEIVEFTKIPCPTEIIIEVQPTSATTIIENKDIAILILSFITLFTDKFRFISSSKKLWTLLQVVTQCTGPVSRQEFLIHSFYLLKYMSSLTFQTTIVGHSGLHWREITMSYYVDYETPEKFQEDFFAQTLDYRHVWFWETFCFFLILTACTCFLVLLIGVHQFILFSILTPITFVCAVIWNRPRKFSMKEKQRLLTLFQYLKNLRKTQVSGLSHYLVLEDAVHHTDKRMKVDAVHHSWEYVLVKDVTHYQSLFSAEKDEGSEIELKNYEERQIDLKTISDSRLRSTQCKFVAPSFWMTKKSLIRFYFFCLWLFIWVFNTVLHGATKSGMCSIGNVIYDILPCSRGGWGTWLTIRNWNDYLFAINLLTILVYILHALKSDSRNKRPEWIESEEVRDFSEAPYLTTTQYLETKPSLAAIEGFMKVFRTQFHVHQGPYLCLHYLFAFIWLLTPCFISALLILNLNHIQPCCETQPPPDAGLVTSVEIQRLAHSCFYFFAAVGLGLLFLGYMWRQESTKKV